MHGRTIEEDLAKRDFTINALAEPVTGGDCIDPFGGREDLQARRLAAIDGTLFADPVGAALFKTAALPTMANVRFQCP